MFDPDRRLPVRPDLRQLKQQAKDFLRAVRGSDADAIADLSRFHPNAPPYGEAKLADAQHVIARSYGASSWPRLVQSCELIDAIWRDDPSAVRALVTRNPNLLSENAGIRGVNWGPPMSYAANLGRDDIIAMLHSLGASDFEHAIGRAALQGQVDTARLLHRLSGSRHIADGELGGPAYTLNAAGTKVLLDLGARLYDDAGRCLAPIDVVLQSDSRRPADKHAILQMYAERGVELPDTPPMALHRGRIDLLEAHLARDPQLLRRTFAQDEIFPPSLGCVEPDPATHGTPLAGTTLLHLAVDFEELVIVKWLLDRGMDPNARAATDPDGFGGHTALFGTVVSQEAFWINFQHQPPRADFTQLLLARGATANVRASLRKAVNLRRGPRVVREYRDVTPLSWGERYDDRLWVNVEAMKLIEAAGGSK